MPTRAEIRAERERNAQRAARGADDSALAALNEAPLAQLSTFGAKTMKQVVGIHRKFTDWAHSVYTLEELDPEEVLAPNSKIKLTYGHITAFLLSSLSQMKGRSGDDGDQLKFSSAILYWEGFRTCYTYYTGKSLPKDLCVQVRGYVRDELPVKLDLSKDPPSRPFVPFAIFTLMVRYLLSSAMAWITTRQRWQSLAGLAILLNTGMRGGSIWRSLNEEIDKEDLLWGGLTLSIYKIEEDQGDGPNRLVLRFMAPNGKTANARNTEAVITQTTEHWNDPLLYILILAHGAGALPTDWTIEQMYDPSIFHSIDQAVLHLSFNKKQEPVFVKQTTELLPDKRAWTVKQFCDAMGRVCQKMGLARTVTAHVIRRSVHLALKMSGVGFQEIGRQLLHAWGSTTHQVYISNLLTSDLSGIIHGETGTFQDTLQLHPDIIKFIPLNETLNASHYREIFEKPSVAQAVDNVEDLTTRLKDQYKVDKVAQLPPPQIRAVGAAYNRFRLIFRQYEAYYRQRLVGESKAQAGNALSEVPEPTVHFDLTEIDPDDEQWLNESEKEDESEDLPGDAIDYEVLALEQFYTQNDLSSRPQALNNSFDCGFLTQEQMTNAMIGIDDEELNHLPNGWECMNTGLNDGGIAEETTFASATGPAFDSTSLDPQLGAPPTAGPSGSTSKEQVDDVPDLQAGEDLQQVIGNSNWRLDRLSNMVFNPEKHTKVDLFNALTSLPNDPFAVYGFRPGHAPINGNCPCCLVSFDSIIPAGSVKQLRDRAMVSHVNSCFADAASEGIKQVLVDRYSPNSTFTAHPITGKEQVIGSARGARRSIKPKPYEWWKFYPNSLSNLFSPKAELVDYPTCGVCQDGTVLYTAEQANKHILVKHQTYLPMSLPSKEVQKSIEEQPTPQMTMENVTFPPAVYYTHDGQYHPDPAEVETFAETVYHERILQPGRLANGYAIRPDVVIPPGVLLEDQFDNGAIDSRYDGIQAGEVLISESICIICATNHHLPWSKRIAPHNMMRIHLRKHRQVCMFALIRDLYKAKIEFENHCLPTRHSPFFDDGVFKCLDESCLKRERTCETILELVQHFVAAHNYVFKGTVKQRGAQESRHLVQLTWPDEESMIADAVGYVKAKRERHEEEKEAKNTAKGKEKEVVEGSTSDIKGKRKRVEREDNLDEDE